MQNDLSFKAVATIILGIAAVICVFSQTAAAGFGMFAAVVGFFLGRSARLEAKSKAVTVGYILNAIVLIFCAVGIIAAIFS